MPFFSSARRIAVWSSLALPGALSAQGAAAGGAGLDQGIQLYRAKKYDEAKAMFLPASSGGNTLATYWLGRVALDQDKLDEAAAYFERAVKADDKSSEFHLWLGRAYGEKAQHASVFKQAMLARRTKSEFERAVELDPQNLDARADLITYYMMAPGVMGGSHDKAKQEAEEIRKLNPYRGGLETASIATQEKNAAAAEEDYRALARSYPDSSAPVVLLGLALQGEQKWADAFALFDGVLAKKPDDATALYQLGKTAALSGERLDDGDAALRKYLATPLTKGAPSYAGAHYRLGMIEERKGRTAAARTEYETAVSLDPKLEDAKKALGKLRP